MELDSIECVPSLDLTDEDEIHQHQFPSISKAHNNSNNNTSLASVIHPGTTSVHELLECPVCTNSMYPPIHQVCSLPQFGSWVLYFFSVDLLLFIIFCCFSLLVFFNYYFYDNTECSFVVS